MEEGRERMDWCELRKVLLNDDDGIRREVRKRVNPISGE